MHVLIFKFCEIKLFIYSFSFIFEARHIGVWHLYSHLVFINLAIFDYRFLTERYTTGAGLHLSVFFF